MARSPQAPDPASDTKPKRDSSGPRRIEGTDRRREIIEAAAELFASRGYRATTIRQVSDAAGILSGSLYAHIKSKEDLLYEIAVLDMEIFLDALRPIAEMDAPADKRLREGLQAHLELVSRYGQQARLFLLEAREIKTPERCQHVEELGNEYDALWTRILEDGQRDGTFVDIDLRLARIAILSLANWAYFWLDPHGRLAPPEVASGFSDILLRGLLNTRP